MIEILPVEQVLYLDADILIRKSLKALWDVDLGGKCLAAATDVGFPIGFDEMHGRPYFNSGVLLMDIAKARLDIKDLKKLATQMKDTRYKDQDVLNIYYSQSWASLSLTWNAQGLGTYAHYPSEDRKKLSLEDMTDPSVVHFTGPVHPSMIAVLDPNAQPPIAKPWGYLGSPGHPYESDWWAVLERTPWKGIQLSENWSVTHANAINKEIAIAMDKFKKLVTK